VRLLPIEQDRLTVFLAAELARRRRLRGLLLTHPEAVALIADEMHEAARSGAEYPEVVRVASRVLTEEEVLPGVSSLVASVKVECLFHDGLRLVVATAPIKPAKGAQGKSAMVPGLRTPADEPIEVHAGATRVTVEVRNASPDVIWVGSHFPFFEVNRGLRFKRGLAWGRHLDLPAGDAMRFGPGEQKEVTLVDFAGHRVIRGFNGLTEGAATKARLGGGLRRAKKAGYPDTDAVE
jgi:urease subunit gamma/beta